MSRQNSEIADGEIELTSFMRECLDKVAKNEGFSSYVFYVDQGSAVGDGFVGVLLKVTIQENISEKKLIVVVKSPPENLVRRRDFGAMRLFEREVFVYKQMLPEFGEFLASHNMQDIEGFSNFPKCYYAEYNEEKDDAIIIMEDLRIEGYQMLKKVVPVDLEHTTLLLSALGRLHAISLAMKHQKPEIFQKYREMYDNTADNMKNEQIATFVIGCMDRAIGTLNESEELKKNKLQKYRDNFMELMTKLVDPKGAEPYAVVGHGDCWVNNMMWKYHDGTPERIVLLDWQASRYLSPAIDLVYFMFVCTDHKLRSKHFVELLNIYHHSLKELLEKLGCDASIFPFTALLRQLKMFGKYGIFVSAFVLPMITMKNEDIPDVNELADNLENSETPSLEQSMAKGFENDAYTKRMSSNILDAFSYGYL